MIDLKQEVVTHLEKARRNEKGRRILAIVLIVILLLISARLIFNLIPKNYILSVTSGSVLSERHFLIKLLQDEAPFLQTIQGFPNSNHGLHSRPIRIDARFLQQL